MRFHAVAILGSTLLALTLTAGIPSARAEPIGLVTRLQNTAYGTPPQAARVPKQKRDGIDFKELIETAPDSAIEIGFVDGSNMTIGADAEVYIDAFVFDQDSATGEALVTLSQGAFRWVTGIMPPGGVRFETPTATITIRGTNVKIGVKPNGDTLLGLDDGEVGIVAKGKGDAATLKTGQGARVTPAGIEVFDQVLPVADAIVDGGWANATGIGHDRDRSNSGGNGGGNQ